MQNYFVAKLRHVGSLTNDDTASIGALCEQTRRVQARRDIKSSDDEGRHLPLILDGWACRYSSLPNGKYQMITLYLPGDLCEPFGALPRCADYPVAALTPVTYTPVRVDLIRTAAEQSPRIYSALWWDLMFASAIEREHIVSLGRRSAAERLGHLFCELQLRLQLIALADERGFEMPLTQSDLADLLGLTPVHVNRSLQDLRRSGLISLRNRRLEIHRLAELRDLSFFDPSYLPIDNAPSP